MNCKYYQNDILHTMPHELQQEHLKTCVLCRKRYEYEERIMREVSQLTPHYPENSLWLQIEKSLGQTLLQRRSFIKTVKSHSGLWLSAAALIIVLVSFSAIYIFYGGSDKILSEGALIRVELTEQNYIKAIEDLEKKAQPKLSGFNTEFMLLYRDKLETIERQIDLCRLAIENNPGNAHIRRYLLSALQDKKDTLREILEI